LWLCDANAAYFIAREFIVTVSDAYDATNMAQIDETRERAGCERTRATRRRIFLDEVARLLAQRRADLVHFAELC